MTYALYGQAAGARSGLERQLWSHHARPGDKPLVEFEFALGSERLRAVRSPPYRRKGRNGEERDAPAEAALFRLEGREWLPLADRITEVDEAIRGRLGLSVQEFSKIVLLPQGEFQRFLEMDSGERVTILEKLFPVDLHEAVTALAREKHKAAAESLRRLNDEISRLRADPALGMAPEGDVEAGRRSLSESVDGLARERETALEASIAAESAAAKGREDLLRVRNAEEARARLAVLEAAAPEEGLRSARIAAARRAMAALPPVEAAARAAETLQAERRACGERRQELARLEARAGEVAAARERAAATAKKLAAMDRELGNLAAAAEAWKEAKKAEASLQEARGGLEAARRAVTEAEERGRRAEAELQATGLSSDEVGRVNAEFEAAMTSLEVAKRRAELAISCWERRKERADAEEAAKKAEAALRSAEEALAAREAAESRTAAAHLAAGLRPGEPCPVCGSLYHPRPAHAGESNEAGIWPGPIEDLKTERDLALAAHSTALGELEAARRVEAAAFASFSAEAPEPPDSPEPAEPPEPPEPSEARRLRQAAEKTAQTAAAAFRGLAARRAAGDAARAALDAARNEHAERLAALGTAQTAFAGLEATHRSALARTPGSDPGPGIARLEKERIKLGEARAADLAAVEAWAAAAATARARAEESAARLPALEAGVEAGSLIADKALRDAGFAGPDAARAAAMTADSLAREEAASAAWRSSLDEARAAAREAERAMGSGPPPDLAALERGQAEARQRLDEAQRALDAARGELSSFDRAAEALVRAGDERRNLAASAERLAGLSALLSGDLPSRRLPFKSFVLGLYFRDVVERSSVRLAEMSDGRYGLLSAEGNAGGRGRIGLELLVSDSYTGRVRPAGTLSGGERFLTSLSLALGLADTIRSRSGGAALDAVFVDEGFGSLDEEALDRAVAALDRARGARMIGIVSHVPELRSRIGSRIEVTRGRGGSTLEIV
jgi:exonuclease SbcC